jgi:hypothetical protein
VPGPGVAKPDFGDNLRKAAGKISFPYGTEIAFAGIDDGNPIMLGGSVDRERKFNRPPIRSTLMDEGYQFGGGFLGAIDHFHEDIA